jgi:hypothetical protein
MGSGRCRTICGMTQWRGIEAVRVTKTPLDRESLQSDSKESKNSFRFNRLNRSELSAMTPSVRQMCASQPMF